MRTAPVPLKTVALPTEHGGWGFTLEPLLLGLLLAPSPLGLGLFLLGLFGFLARHPLKLTYQDLRKGRRYPRTRLALQVAALYGALAASGLLLAFLTARGPFWLPLLLALPLGAYMLYADAQNQSRALFPELAAALTMASLAPAMVLGAGREAQVALGAFLALALRDVASLYYARTQVLRARGETPRRYPALLALWGSLAGASGLWALGLLPGPVPAALALLALYGSLSLFRPPVRANAVGWTQMGFGLLVVLATALGYTLWGEATAFLHLPSFHRGLGYGLVGLGFALGAYLLLYSPGRWVRVLLGLYDLNALAGLLYLALGGRAWLHPALAVLAVVLFHLALRQKPPWRGLLFWLGAGLLLVH
ncbi:YwiC-like family protein [Thermus filiformis]|uniref:YwiC-like protein n=1 Tax=Thermus filiformis TaxID=276 RepID=A0A0A2WPX4_THEFI|nr:YwiC-like family protein [Thermus filiformis]KGQ22176.2 hypothetical protein THFILI_07860 [Thermus filiformis]